MIIWIVININEELLLHLGGTNTGNRIPFKEHPLFFSLISALPLLLLSCECECRDDPLYLFVALFRRWTPPSKCVTQLRREVAVALTFPIKDMEAFQWKAVENEILLVHSLCADLLTSHLFREQPSEPSISSSTSRQAAEANWGWARIGIEWQCDGRCYKKSNRFDGCFIENR